MAKRLNKNLVGGLTILGFVLLTVAGVLMANALRQVDPEQYAEKAAQAEKDGDYERAAIYYARAFQVSKPPDPKYLVARGNMHQLDGDELLAIAVWRQAVTIDPELLEGHIKLLDLYLEYGSALDIKSTAESILSVEDKNPKGLHGLGIALIRLEGQPEGDREKGIELLEEACAVAPEVYEYAQTLLQQRLVAAVNLIATDQEKGRKQLVSALDLARELVGKHITPGEDAVTARSGYARLLSARFGPEQEAILVEVYDDHLTGRDRFAEAERLYQEGLEKAGDDPEVRSTAMTALADHWFKQGLDSSDETAAEEYFAKARDLARKAIETDLTSFAPYSLLARMHARDGEFEKAADVCVERTKQPVDREGFGARREKGALVALLKYAAEQYISAASREDAASQKRSDLAEQAVRLIEDAQAEMPDPEQDGGALYILGKARYVQGKEREALGYLERAEQAERSPGWQNKRLLGILRHQLGQYGAARAILREATRDPRADASTWSALGRVHLALGDPELAIMAADEALRRNPELVDAIRVRMDANSNLGRDDLANEGLAKMGSGKATDLIRARLLARQGKFDESYDMLARMLAAKPDNQQALRLLGAVARELGKEREALALATKAVESASEGADLFELRAIEVSLNPDLTDDERKDRILTSIREVADDYLRTRRLAEFYRMDKRLPEALEEYRKATQMLVDGTTDGARRVGESALLGCLENRMLIAAELEQWDEMDSVVQIAMTENVDGANGMTFKGRASLFRNEYDAATEAFKLALEDQPSQSETWAWLGQAQYNANRKTEALAAFARAVEMNPDNFLAQRWLARLAKVNGDTAEYNLRLDECVRLRPDDDWVRKQELVRQEERSPQDGIERREALYAEQPDDLSNTLQLARLYGLVGNQERAEHYYDIALKHDAAATGVAWRAANFLVEIGKQDRAFQVLADAQGRMESKEDQATLLVMASALHRQLGDVNAAEGQLRQAVDLYPGESTYHRFGQHYRELRKYPEAIKWMDKAIQAADEAESALAPKIRAERFEILLQTGDYGKARDAVTEYRQLYPDELAGYLLESELHFVLGQLGESIEELSRYLQDHPDATAVLFRRAQHYASQQRWQAAIADLKDLRAINPDALNYSPRLLLVRAHEMTGHPDLALSEMRSLYEDHPENRDICQRYFQYYIDHGLFAEAEKLATALVNRDPNSPEWYILAGQVALRLNDGVKALSNYLRATELTGYSGQYTSELLGAYGHFENYDAGISLYEGKLTKEQKLPSVIYKYANLLVKVGRTEDAVRAYREALTAPEAFRNEHFVVRVAVAAADSLGLERAVEMFSSDPKDERLIRPNQHILAILQNNTDKRSEAKATLESLINTSTDNLEKAGLYGRKGIIAEREENLAEARQCYEEAVKLNPDNWFVLNNLAYLLADKLNNSHDAIPYAERAAQIHKIPAILDTLAWTLVQVGEYGRAIGLLSMALQQDPGYVDGIYHLGEAYRRTSKFSEAALQYEQGIKGLTGAEDGAMLEQMKAGLQKAQEQDATP